MRDETLRPLFHLPSREGFMSRLFLFVLCWQLTACNANEEVLTRNVGRQFCSNAMHLAIKADSMRYRASQKLARAADFVELSIRLENNESLSEDDQQLMKTLGGKETVWRMVWQHTDAALAWCEASVHLHDLVVREVNSIIELNILKDQPESRKTLDNLIRSGMDKEIRHCDPGKFHSFGANYRKEVLDALNDRFQKQKTYIDKLVQAACQEFTANK
jgi:hypothetical protein